MERQLSISNMSIRRMAREWLEVIGRFASRPGKQAKRNRLAMLIK
jgi:hypothetical protein